MTAHKMTGIGYYGPPHQLTKMLAKVLVRCDRVPVAIREEGRPDPSRVAGHGATTPVGQKALATGQVRSAIPAEADLTGFYLSIYEGRAELHLRIRGHHKGRPPSTGR